MTLQFPLTNGRLRIAQGIFFASSGVDGHAVQGGSVLQLSGQLDETIRDSMSLDMPGPRYEPRIRDSRYQARPTGNLFNQMNKPGRDHVPGDIACLNGQLQVELKSGMPARAFTFNAPGRLRLACRGSRARATSQLWARFLAYDCRRY